MSGRSTGGDINWPDGFDRTPQEERIPYPGGFEVSRPRAFNSILDELEQMGATDIDIQTCAPHSVKALHRPREDSEPDDPTVVVYFERDSKDYCAPCDKWDNLRDNARAIARYLNVKRAIERYGVATVDTELSTQVLQRVARSEGVEPSSNDGADADSGLPTCANCGAANNASETFCDDCGYRL
jgi:hypothetical protein